MRWPSPRIRGYLLLWIVFGLTIEWRRGSLEPTQFTPAQTPGEPFVLRLNHDPWHRFLLLEGIGPKLAQRIVSERERRGRFESIEEVQRISGVPDKPFDEARSWIRID